MPAANLVVIPPTLPSNWCFDTWQEFVNTAVGGAVVQLEGSGFTVVISSATAPAAVDRDKLWHNTGDDLVYRWNNSLGFWVRRHEVTPASPVRRLWVGTLAALETYDGGEAGTVGDIAGPMWAEDTIFRARMPLGVGTLPLSGTAVAVQGVGGLEKVALTIAEMPAHSHTYDKTLSRGAGGSGGTAWVEPDTTSVTSTTGGGTAHENMPPWLGCYFVKRTARIYRKAT